MPARLADLTTLRLGGPIEDVITATTRGELVDAVRSADSAGVDLLLVGGGSNLVAADAGWPGRTVVVRTRGVELSDVDSTGAESAGMAGADVLVRAEAGEPWDDLVARTLAEGLSGLETMSGIPGLTGATPVQNVGAYGAEISDVLIELTVLDRASGRVEQWTPAQCDFGFRTSAFKHTDRYVVLEVMLRLRRRAESAPVRYLELARRLGVEPGATAPVADVRAAVLALRRRKGMVLDAEDHDTWSVGSFFVNPLLAVVPPAARECPQWPADGAVKLSAAWLIEQAGFQRGYGNDKVAVSTKHSLALTNRGGATTTDLLALGREIRVGVEARFGIRLRPEARLAPNLPLF